MAETEVESILREIRERVLSQQRAGQGVATLRAEAATGGNGAGEAGATRQPARLEVSEALVEESLALINSYLTTTARTWDRLPPLVSNRSGLVARLELWLKRRLKSGTRWFTWEQVNFNAAVHHALRDLLQVLTTQQQELGKLRARIEVEAETRQIEIERHQTDLMAHGEEQEAQRQMIEALRLQTDARLAELTRELSEREAHLQAEQRVCFKQLALEASEAAVLEDRARRKTEALLEELGRRLEQLENK